MKITIFYSLLVLLCPICLAEPLVEGAFDTINISADEAIEDEKPGVLHLRGNFMMQSESWHLTSSQATVYGSPTKPDRILLQGSPARFTFLPGDEVGADKIEASALEVEYQRQDNSLMLTGKARLLLGEETIYSSSIRYDSTANRYLAGGDNGVNIKLPPKD
mgnify:CR=1 FL=1